MVLIKVVSKNKTYVPPAPKLLQLVCRFFRTARKFIIVPNNEVALSPARGEGNFQGHISHLRDASNGEVFRPSPVGFTSASNMGCILVGHSRKTRSFLRSNFSRGTANFRTIFHANSREASTFVSFVNDDSMKYVFSERLIEHVWTQLSGWPPGGSREEKGSSKSIIDLYRTPFGKLIF